MPFCASEAKQLCNADVYSFGYQVTNALSADSYLRRGEILQQLFLESSPNNALNDRVQPRPKPRS